MADAVATPLEMFYQWERTTPAKGFLRQPVARQWTEATWAQAADEVPRIATFGDELRSVQPDFFFAAPRLWAKFKQGVDAKIPPAAQKNLTDEQKAGIRRQLGLGNARFVLTGSAPCPKEGSNGSSTRASGCATATG